MQLHSNEVPQEVRFAQLLIETHPEDVLTTLSAPPIPPAVGSSEILTLFNGVDFSG